MGKVEAFEEAHRDVHALVSTLRAHRSGPSSRRVARRDASRGSCREGSRHLKNIRQVTFGFAKAGEGYFRPDGKAIIFQAVPNLPPSIFHTPADNENDYQIFTADLDPDAKPKLVSTGKGACTCCYYHPTASRSSSARPTSTRRPVGPEGPGL